jgi:hypothetical protein
LSEDGSRFIDKSYNEFLSTLPAEVKIINADPGVYNYSVSYTTPDSTLGKESEEGNRATIARPLEETADIQRELALSRKDDSRLDAAGSLAERLAEKREEEAYDRLLYVRDYNPTPKTNKEDIKEILTEPGAPAPESTDSAVSEIFKSNGKIDLDSIPGSFDRKGFDKERINPLKVLRARIWWNSKKLEPLKTDYKEV